MYRVWVMVLLVLTLWSCEKPEPVDNRHIIGFASHMSRAIIESADDLKQDSNGLKLYASYTMNEDLARLLDGEKLYFDNGIWQYDNTRYWVPGMLYHFCVIYPYSTPCSYNDNGEITIAYEGKTTSTDLLYASSMRDLTSSEDYSAVPLQFDHACAALQFNIINASTSTITGVRNVRLTGLYNKGTFFFNSLGTAKWTIDENSRLTSTTDNTYGGTCTLPNGGLPVNVSTKHSLYDNGAILVVPQDIYKSSVALSLEYTTSSNPNAPNANWVTPPSNPIELGKLGGSTPTEWRAGKRYNYNLTLTDKYITAEVKVVDWVDHYVDL